MARTALVIDDAPEVQALVRTVLESGGYTVVAATDGPKGVALAAAHPPDVILLDLMMPGIDGYETCQRLKADPRTRALPVIFLTASPDMSLNRRAYALGAVACIPKPFRPTSLLATFAAVVPKLAESSRAAG